MRKAIAVLSLVAAAGCRRSEPVVVTVDGVSLTAAKAAAELRIMTSAVPSNRLNTARPTIMNEVVRQFVMRTLLLKEADRWQIAVTKEEEASAFDRIRTNLPPNTTLETVLRSSPIGEEAMREEVRTGLKINKLLAMRFSNEVDVSEAEVSSFMARNRDATLLPERVHARHILVAVDGKDDERARAAKRKRIEAARQEVLAGGDFAQTATKYSDCPSRRWGGDLGTFARGQKAKPLGDAAFSQEPGAVGPIVETKSGYHIVQVLDHKEAGRMPREEVAAMLRSRKQETALTAFLNELKSKATITYGDPRRRSERR